MNNYVYGESIEQAWLLASKKALEEGVKYDSIIEILNVTLEILPNYASQEFDTNFRKIFGDDRIDYASLYTFNKPVKRDDGTFIYKPIKNPWNATYFGRMCNFRGQFNQIENVLKTLKKGQNVKRCEIIIYDPMVDAKNMYSQPCLLCIDIKPRNGRLTISSFFRSQAISKSGYADYTAILNLGKFLAEESDTQLERLYFYITSLHVRKENDELNKTKRMMEVISA